MGKLLIFVAVIAVTVIILAIWGLFLTNRQERFKMGLQGSKARIEELEAGTARQTAALEDIRQIAEASAVSDPLFDLIARKATEALKEEETS